MRRFTAASLALVLCPWLGLAAMAGSGAKAETGDEQEQSSPNSQGDLREEIERLKRAIAVMEGRLKAQEEQAKAQEEQAKAQAEAQKAQAEAQKAQAEAQKAQAEAQKAQAEAQKAQAEAQKAQAEAQKAQKATEEAAASLKELDERVSANERTQALDRVHFTGDYRFEAHSILGSIPAHYDGMALQNLVVKSMFAMSVLGRPPMSVAEINHTVGANYSNYQLFTSSLTFSQIKQAMGSMPAAMQQQLMGMLMPSTYVGSYENNNASLFTNRLRLNFDAKVAENVSFTGRLSMYKVFGDSSGVQLFDGQPTSMSMDGTTVGVPSSDQLRVDRAFFSWNNIGGSKFYLSVGRRPSTGGPPMNFRQDELRGGTPSGALVDFQFDGITAGYKVSDTMTWRLCWGLGYESGWGNGNLLKLPQDRLKDTHLVGANIDVYNTEDTLIQATYAFASHVTDGFTGTVVLPVNPLTGDRINAPVVMRYSPSANLGNIHLFGVNASHRFGPMDLYGSGNLSATRPNGVTTPFGGLMADPFETPVNRSGGMVLAGARYIFSNGDRTKLGFEFNRGTKYWFNFAQAADDIIAPKTNTRGNVVEAYLTHRINERFIFKADYIRYMYDYSGSGWHVGAPKDLDSVPTLGFPTYRRASMLSVGLTTRF